MRAGGGLDAIKNDSANWKHFVLANRWLPSWRYDPDLSSREDAEDFLKAVDAVLGWMRNNLWIGTISMADAALKAKIRETLKQTYFRDPEDAVYVSDSNEPGDDVHVVIVSPKFHGKRLREKTDLILSQLFQTLQPAEWGKVTLSVGVSPEELKEL
jgi:hypothetical protein